ncbi:thioester reductase domain-containing protein [Micromonospora sp. NPDC003197]
MTDVLPLTAAQAGIWAGQQLDLTSPAYNAGEYVELRGPLDVPVFEAALRQAMAEAEALHARFTDAPAQHLDSTIGWPLHRVEVAGQAEALTWMRADLATPVDLTAGPLFTQALISTGPDTHLWYQRVHHIAADGYAFALLARRVAQLYTAARTGRDSPRGRFAPVRPVLDEDLVYQGSERYTTDREFWTEYLADAPAPVSLAPATPMGHGVRRHRVALPATLDASGTGWPDLVLAAVVALLHRRTGAGEVVLGLPVMGRLGSAALRVPCMAMNIVPMRIPVPPEATLTDLATVVADQLRVTRPHHRYRYEQLRRDLGLVGGDRRLFGPVVNIMPFDYRLAFDGLTATSHNVSAGPVEDLSVAVADRGDGRHLDLDANPAAYSAADLAGYADELLDLLATAQRDTPVTRTVPILDGGPLPVPAEPVTELIRRAATTHPDRAAVVDGPRQVTYAELLADATGTADRLTALGAGPGTLVAVALPRGVEAVTAILGTLLSGAAYLPLDPDGPVERAETVLADARPALSITADGIQRRSDGIDRDPDLGYVIYTSGSTGRPNGVAVGRAALAHFVAGATHRYGITGTDRVLQFAPLHFDASVEEIFLTLGAGGTLVVRTEHMLESIADLLAGCAEYGVTVLDLPTAYWHELAYAGLPMPLGLRTVIIGGEAALPERVARWHETVGADVRLFNTYGPTEATVVATVAELTPDETEVPIGLPLPGVRCAVVHDELWLLGGGLATGYLGQPELTARRFGALAGARAYRTGDRVRLRPDGQLAFAGRVDDEFKISGHRVDPGEVESVLLRHPAVAEAAVVGKAGAGGVKHLVAHVVTDLSDVELREHAGRALPAAVVPAVFVRTSRLPRTSSGKIDRTALRAVEVVPVAADEPASDAERAVLAVLREVLGVGRIGPDDDFFALGGQSLQSIQVANRLGVPVATVFAYPTAAGLARLLAERSGAAPDSASESALSAGPATDDVAEHVTDAVLPAGIGPRPVPGVGRVLLTGATGFVGIHLLAELLTRSTDRVACLVRAGDAAAGLTRLREALDRHGLRVPMDRVDVVVGDLTQPYAGPPVDAVYHAAASVSVVRGYRSLRPANVDGTRYLLALGVPFHHVSTVAVATEPGFVAAHPGLRDGYQRSKWAAEELVRQAGDRGVPVTVYRLGRVVGPADTGYVNPDDLVWRILRAGVPRGVLPDLGVAEPWTPVDWVAATVVALARSGATGVHNLVPLPPVRLSQVSAWVRDYGFAVEVVPLPIWQDRVRADASDADSATLAFFDQTGPVIPEQAVPSSSVHTGPDAGIQTGSGRQPGSVGVPPLVAGPPCPPVDRALMYRYLDHAVKVGLLPAPSC